MAKVAVNPDVLKWALSRSGLCLSDLEAKLKKIRDWISGSDQPTLRQLELIAKNTNTPLGYLLLDKPLKQTLPIPYYRTLKDDAIDASLDLLETIHEMQRRQAWMRDFLVDEGCEPLSFVGTARSDSTPEEIAEFMRELLDLPTDWSGNAKSWEDAFRLLRESMENAGIMVVVNGVVGNNTHRRLKVEEFRGFVLVDDYAPLTFINGADAKAAQMFTLAHELAHICYGTSAAFDLREIQPSNILIETQCNKAAAEFLVPASEMRNEWAIIKDKEKPFGLLAREFRASELVVARRALDLHLISKAQYFDFYKEYRSRERKESPRNRSGGNFYSTQNMRIGRRFATNVILAVKSDKLLYQDAYRLTGLRGKTFQNYAERLGFVGV